MGIQEYVTSSYKIIIILYKMQLGQDIEQWQRHGNLNDF